MTTQHTPANDRQPSVQVVATPRGPVLQQPPPAMLMSPEQFKVLLEQHRAPADAAQPAAAVNAVAVKLPNFWMSDPELWFMQAEAVFNTRYPKITADSTKFDHILTALPQEMLNSIKGLIRLPVATPDRYVRLKESLILSFGKSVAQKHAELIQFAAAKDPILDQKPSDLFTYVRDLAGDSKEAF